MEYVILGILLVILLYVFSQFNPSATQQIEPDWYVIRCGFVNFYALKTSQGVVLFDTAMSALQAKRGLAACGISANDVTHVFLTHTDYDHAGGVAAFSGATLYLSDAEEQMINGKTARRGILHNRRLHGYQILHDQEVIRVGDVLIQMHLTPGHTPGSAVYLVNDRTLVCGDLLRIAKGKIRPFLRVMNKHHEQSKASLQAAGPMLSDCAYILSGHSGFHKN